MTLIGDVMRYDQMGFRVDGALDVIADMAAVVRARRHGAGIGIGQRDLSIRRIVQHLVHRPEALDFLTDAAVCAREMDHFLGARLAFLLTIDADHFLDVALDARL